MIDLKPVTLAGISGSLRNGAYTTAILQTLVGSVKPNVEIIVGDIGSLPLYNQDLDGDKAPQSVLALKKLVKDCDGLLIVSPEYNYGIPGVLKNAIDWLSRPGYKSPLLGKPFIVITNSPSSIGGARAQIQIRQSLIACLARNVSTREATVAEVQKKVADGKLTDKTTIDFCVEAIGELAKECHMLRPS